jgi:hypothetical protein
MRMPNRKCCIVSNISLGLVWVGKALLLGASHLFRTNMLIEGLTG